MKTTYSTIDNLSSRNLEEIARVIESLYNIKDKIERSDMSEYLLSKLEDIGVIYIPNDAKYCGKTFDSWLDSGVDNWYSSYYSFIFGASMHPEPRLYYYSGEFHVVLKRVLDLFIIQQEGEVTERDIHLFKKEMYNIKYQ